MAQWGWPVLPPDLQERVLQTICAEGIFLQNQRGNLRRVSEQWRGSHDHVLTNLVLTMVLTERNRVWDRADEDATNAEDSVENKQYQDAEVAKLGCLARFPNLLTLSVVFDFSEWQPNFTSDNENTTIWPAPGRELPKSHRFPFWCFDEVFVAVGAGTLLEHLSLAIKEQPLDQDALAAGLAAYMDQDAEPGLLLRHWVRSTKAFATNR